MAKPRSPKGRARRTHERLSTEYEAKCELDHRSPFELLIATILSAQTTDESVNRVSPSLFASFPDAEALAGADPEKVESLLSSLSLYRRKTTSVIRCSEQLVERHRGEVPISMDELTALAGVGRKTANLVRVVAFDQPGLPVDTHVLRLARRLELTTEDDAVKVEHALAALLPVTDRGPMALRLILHGRRVCLARAPRCGDCVLADFCPSSEIG